MTTRRTIRIEVTDFGEDGPGFDGPVSREHATLVREFAADSLLDKSPADLVGALAEWLDGQPRRIEETQQCDFVFREYHPPKLCILPMGHSSSEHTTRR